MSAGRPSDRGCALVTGASGGIGAAVALGLSADGWPVAVHFHSSPEAAEAVVASIRSAGGQAEPIVADLADPAEAAALCERAEEALVHPVLVLVNNAGVSGGGLLRGIDDEAWNRVLETNLTAVFRLTRHSLRSMLRERFGRIVNVSSLAAERPSAGQSGYAASKAGLIGFTKAVAVEVANRAITVNAVAPGFVDTRMVSGVPDELLASIPAGRLGTPDDVAACIRFLVSEEASYVTGSVLTVDGGLSA